MTSRALNATAALPFIQGLRRAAKAARSTAQRRMHTTPPPTNETRPSISVDAAALKSEWEQADSAAADQAPVDPAAPATHLPTDTRPPGSAHPRLLLTYVGAVTAVTVASLTAAIIDPLHLRSAFHLDGHETFITASIGIAASRGENAKPIDLLRNADSAMYRAKSEGHGRYVLFDASRDRYSVDRLSLETDLRRAIDRNQLRLYYQPEIDLVSGAIRGMEALVRWEHPERGLISPAEFIPLAEETGEIVTIGQWVLEEACRVTKAFQKAYPERAALVIGVNLSAEEFAQRDLVWRIAKVLRDSELDPATLRIEITESMVMKDTPLANDVLHQLRSLGVQLAVDDFGTGYSSLEYLRRLPVDALKIDQSFVADLEDNGRTS